MKKCILLFIFFSVFIGLIAQNDTLSVEDRIEAMPLSAYEKITKGRHLLSEEFTAGNINEVKRILDYFDTKIDNAENVSLWNNERLMLYYWTKEYDKIILFAVQPKIGYSLKPSFYPPNDNLEREITEKTGENYNRLLEGIENKHFSEDTNSFLRLLLMRLLMRRDEKYVTLDEVNSGAEKFLRDYPDSPLCKTVKEDISYTFMLSDWGAGFSIFGGYSRTFGNINDMLGANGNFGLSLNLYYKRFVASFFVQPYFGKLKQDIPSGNTVWKKGEYSNLVSFGLTGGYSVFNNNRFRISPFVGVILGTAGPEKDLEDKDPGLKNISLGPSFSGVFGLNAEIKLNNPVNMKSRNPGYLNSVLLRVGYIPGILNSESSMYSGGVFFASVGFTFDYYKLKRKF